MKNMESVSLACYFPLSYDCEHAQSHFVVIHPRTGFAVFSQRGSYDCNDRIHETPGLYWWYWVLICKG
jgi:hypothetical protein